MFLRRNLPQLLEPDAELLRLAILGKTELRDQLLGERAARALGEQRVLGTQLHAARERVLVVAVFADAHVAGGDAGDFAARAVEHLGGRETWIDFNAKRLGLGGEPA